MKYDTKLIHDSISMTDIVKKYGFEPNRAGFICCPFHLEKTASLKIYKGDRGWHCFGCGRNGDVIEFVKLFFNVDFSTAIGIIDNDFNLGLTKKPTLTQFRRMSERVRVAEEKRKEEKSKEKRYWEIFDRWKLYSDNIVKFAPKCPDEEYDDRFVEACHKLPYTEYLLETMR